jgi:TonB family protein
MRWADRSLVVGLCVSLLFHGAVFYTALTDYVHGLSHVYLKAPATRERAVADVSVFKVPDNFGEALGRGTANSSEPGEQPLLAPTGDEVQSLLSRDPQGPTGRPGAQSSAFDAPSDNPAAATASVMAPALADATPTKPQPKSPEVPLPAPNVATEPRAASPRLVGTTLLPASQPATGQGYATAVAIAVAPTPPPSPASAARPSQPAPSSSSPAAPAATPGGGGGSPVPPTDSDSDPFNKSVSVTVRPGGVDARAGRKVRTVRPDLSLAAQTDLMTMGVARVQMAVRIDPTGNVSDVQVLGSSGNNDIDLPCVQAVHQWWFEPTKDSSGKGVSDVILLTITFR